MTTTQYGLADVTAQEIQGTSNPWNGRPERESAYQVLCRILDSYDLRRKNADGVRYDTIGDHVDVRPIGDNFLKAVQLRTSYGRNGVLRRITVKDGKLDLDKVVSVAAEMNASESARQQARERSYRDDQTRYEALKAFTKDLGIQYPDNLHHKWSLGYELTFGNLTAEQVRLLVAEVNRVRRTA